MSSAFGTRTRPTRHELLKLQKRLTQAVRAHKLLEEKYRILNIEKEKTQETLSPIEEIMIDRFQKAYIRLLEALRHSSLSKLKLAEALSKANDEFSLSWTTVHGISAPKLYSKIRKRTPIERGYGLSNTDPWIDDVAEAFEEALQQAVIVAETRNLLKILVAESEKTRIRVVALEKFLIPQLEKDIRRIELVLQEREMEQFNTQKWLREQRDSEINKLFIESNK